MRSEVLLAAAWMAAAAGLASPAMAQESPTPAYQHYEQPVECIVAAERVGRGYWRLRRPDTVSVHWTRDTLPTVVVTAARECGARFQPATVPVGSLLDLARLALIAGRDDVVTAAIDRRLAHVPSLAERATVLYDIVSWLLDARPYHAALVAKYQSQLDALGAAATIPRMIVYSRIGGMAMQDTDFATVERAVHAGIKLYKAAPAASLDTVMYWSQLNGQFVGLGRVAWLLHGKAALQAVADSSLALLGSERDGGLVLGFLGRLGKPAPSLPMLVRSGSDSSNQRPAPGQLTLIASRCFGPAVDHTGMGYERCYREYAGQRRLLAAFADRGLTAVTVYRTNGYFRNSGPLTAEQEADSARRYAREHFPFPGPFLVVETQFIKIDDGRFLPQRDGGEFGWDELIGTDGTFQMVFCLFTRDYNCEGMYAWVLQHRLLPTANAQADSHAHE
ncbi:MAG TPA: hypothetical protein VNW46_08890 [Gemmatimonadaceae bacterium]|jgi:hypothetical protein|nr:hypothetical protein [Gemmatimonadaceae bacterium]